MTRRVEFFFDFMSPPTYLAYTQMPGLAARTGAEIVWRPMFTLGLFELTGNRPSRDIPNKMAWTRKDLRRFAKRYSVPFVDNSHMDSVKIIPPLRGAFVAQELGVFPAYCKAMFEGMWLEDLNIGELETWRSLIARAGLEPEAFVSGVERPEIKQALRNNNEEAARRGAFGAPSFFVGNELFWGQDRLDFVEQELLKIPL